MFDRDQAMADINRTQDLYVKQLIDLLNDPKEQYFKEVNFTSDTGTGKTNMTAKLINNFSDKFFLITTLSKGQLNNQIGSALLNLVDNDKQNMYKVFGTAQYKNNTILKEEDILNLLPKNKEVIWVRDEGHIHTNKWADTLTDRCWRIINMSATNKEGYGIRTNFAHTMMLRTVVQQNGTPEEALKKLLEVKDKHKNVPKYNPCAIMRCLDDETTQLVVDACNKFNLKYINITEEDFDMSDLCKDDNEYDVIINKFKIVEGVDIRRAHVLYMTNEPSNPATTIQLIGRCRRNALLYREDVDIFKDSELLKNTRTSYVYYNVKGMTVNSDEDGNLIATFCDKISCEKLLVGTTIHVEDGVLYNGLKVVELEGCTGDYIVTKDPELGFNVVVPENEFYKCENIDFEDRVKLIINRKDSSRYILDNLSISKQEILKQPKIKGSEVDYTGKTNIVEYYDFNSLLEKHFKQVEKNKRFNRTKAVIIATENTKPYHLITEETRKRLLGILDENCKVKREKKSKNRFVAYYSQVITNPTLTKDKIALDLDSYKTGSPVNYYLIEKLLPAPQEFSIEVSTRKEFKKECKRIKKLPLYAEQVKINLLNLIDECEYIYKKYKKLDPQKMIPNPENTEYAVSCEHGSIYAHNGLLKCFSVNNYYLSSYTKILNDRETAITGVEHFKYIKNKNMEGFIPDCAVTSLVSKSSKFSSFITDKYKDIYEEALTHKFSGKREFDFSKKCNSCLGYCVEYYAKYLVYGENYLYEEIREACSEAKTDINKQNKNSIIVKACLIKYREEMKAAYGDSMGKIIKTIGAQELIKQEYSSFVNTVIELGAKTATFVKNNMNPVVDNCLYDPNLSVRHIKALADFIDENTIIDIKCTQSVGAKEIKQVLAYHYLSTKRSDLNIKKVILYNPIFDKSIVIDNLSA